MHSKLAHRAVQCTERKRLGEHQQYYSRQTFYSLLLVKGTIATAKSGCKSRGMIILLFLSATV